jgi:hypothetical protein
MNISQFKIQACCGRTSIVFKTDRPITQKDVESLEKLGFVAASQFLKAGIIHMENLTLLITAPLQSDRLTVKPKSEKDKDKIVNDFEELLKTIG